MGIIKGGGVTGRVRRGIALVSGGMDSCVAAAIAHDECQEVAFLHVGYGQRTAQREQFAFEQIADAYHVEKRLLVSLQHLTQIGGSALTNHKIPVPVADLNSKEIPVSYVPFRNAHLLAIAVSWAEVIDASRVYIGAVFEDSSGYPDCRPEFYDAYNQAIAVGTKRPCKVLTPLINWTKGTIVRRGVAMTAPLRLTWSCYQNSDMACGECDSCALRLRGFAQAGVPDPIPYAIPIDYRRFVASRDQLPPESEGEQDTAGY